MKHQRIGLAWMVRQELGRYRGGLLADEMVILLSYHHTFGSLRLIIYIVTDCDCVSIIMNQ
jgi:hypothetical protein